MDRLMEKEAFEAPLKEWGAQIDISYPNYSRAERIADGVVHVVGVGTAISGIAALFLLSTLPMDGRMLSATIIYSITLFLMLAASAVYHMAAAALRPGERWSLDFVSDTFGASRKFRMLAVNDDCCRENLCLMADTSISGARVARELDALVRVYGTHTRPLSGELTNALKPALGRGLEL